jgi:hypothetical protein
MSRMQIAHRSLNSLCKLSGLTHLTKLTTSDSFAAPNPNDDIPTIPADIRQDGSSAQLTKPNIPIHVPHGEALDVPDMNRPPPVEGAEEGEGSLDAMGRPIPTEELFVKDAFLVFRALCKLSMKALVTETYVLLPLYKIGADEQRERSEIFSYEIETPITPSRPHYPQVACRLVHQSSYQYPFQYLYGNDSVLAGYQAVPLP